MMVAAPFGFYGSGNIGDEATLQGFARLVRISGQKWDVAVASQDPTHTARVEPAFRYHQYQGAIWGVRPQLAAHLARGYVFPGGTPIMDGLGDWPLATLAPMVEHARKWKKPAVFVGVGTEQLERPQSRAIVRDQIAGHVAHWSVRAQRDRDRLIDLGVPVDRITVAADMAWLLPSADLEHGRRTLGGQLADGRPLVGVNVNAEEALMKRSPGLFHELARALDEIIDRHDARVVFLSNEIRDEPTFDLAAARQVKAHMRRGDLAVVASAEYLSPPQMMSIIGCCALTISTRYHFCLFSARQGAPFIAITRSDKVADLCADLDWAHAAPPEAADAQTLVAHADSLLAEPEAARNRLRIRIETMEARARLNLKALEVLREEAKATRRIDWLKLVIARGVAKAA